MENLSYHSSKMNNTNKVIIAAVIVSLIIAVPVTIHMRQKGEVAEMTGELEDARRQIAELESVNADLETQLEHTENKFSECHAKVKDYEEFFNFEQIGKELVRYGIENVTVLYQATPWTYKAYSDIDKYVNIVGRVRYSGTDLGLLDEDYPGQAIVLVGHGESYHILTTIDYDLPVYVVESNRFVREVK